MASFSSLPQELVDYIVELATPTFDAEHWEERAKLLVNFCLTSKAFLPAARQFLYSEIVLSTSRAVQRFAFDPFQPAALRKFSPIKKLCLLGGNGAGKPAEGEFALPVILRMGNPDCVVVDGHWSVRFSDMAGAVNIAVDSGYQEAILPYSLQKHHRFQFLRRLSLRNYPDALRDIPFTSAVFPSLVSLELYEACANLDRRSVPLIRQLHAGGASYANDVGAGAEFEAFFLITMPKTEAELSCIPRSVKYLNVRGDADRKTIRSFIKSNALPPNLEELQIWEYQRSDEEDERTVRYLKKQCKKLGINLFISEDDPCECGFNEGFFDFLDGLKDRFGLDV